jgi:NAD(P)-dependent dehydrogenase (short-subunit alcohol dehydrogenase family)
MTENPFSLGKKLIIVTGASSGIGKECAISLSQMGANVILLGRNNERLEETIELMMAPEKHVYYTVDILNYNRIKEVIDEIVQNKGKINGLINSAGISTTLPFNSVSPKKMEDFHRTNVIGAMNLTRQIIKPSNITENGGSIVFISSIMSVVGERGKMLYSMTKGALNAAVRSLAIELSHRNIRLNSISPGVVESPMSKRATYYRNQESIKKIKSMHPLGIGHPRDVANACVFLLSDASRWITGINLIVDGGYTVK